MSTSEPIFIDRESISCGYDFDRDPGIYEGGAVATLVAAGPGAVCVVKTKSDDTTDIRYDPRR